MKDYKELSVKEFDRQATIYDDSEAMSISKYPKECYPFIIEILKSRPDTSVLDLGCGTGAVMDLLSKECPEKKLYGLDLSPNMIEEATKKKITNAEFTIGDAENLPYNNESFDAVICNCSFHHYPNPLKSFQEVYRVLRKNGIFLVSDMAANTFIRVLYNNVFLKLMNTGDVHVYSEDEVKTLMKDAGFQQLTWNKKTKWVFMATGKKLIK